MRIQVLFGETQVLVPCGDGKITVSELVDKAIIRYRKVTNKDPDEVIEVVSVHLSDESRTYVDLDDEVAESLEDKETIVVIYHDSSQYTNDGGLSTNSISDDSALAGSSQPFSPDTLEEEEDHTPYTSELQLSLVTDHGLASITESIEYGPDDDEHELAGAGSDHHSSQEMHILTGASQDNELITGGTPWHGTSQHSSSHSQDPHSQDPHSNPDSGYIPGPMRSQESFPLKSQESFGPKSQEVYPHELSYGVSNSNGSPPGGGGSHTHLAAPRSNLKKDTAVSPLTSQKSITGTPTRSSHLHPHGQTNYPMSRGKGMDIPYNNRPGGYATLPPGFHHHDHKQRSPGGMDESPYDNGPRMAHMEWRRAYPGGEYPYHHEMPMYGSLPPGGMLHPDPYYRGSGRFSRPPEALVGHYPPKQKDGRMGRSMSHERVDQQPQSIMMGPGGHPFNHEDYNGPMDYHLSQPSPFYDRPGIFGMPPPGAGGVHPHMLGYDPRFAMGGPSGYSLSQPGVMMSHNYHRPPFPGGRGRGKGEGPWGDRPPQPGRPQSIDEELDINLNEGDEEIEKEREKQGHHRPSPFTRDFRKSVFRDGSVYGAWMDRIQEYGIDETNDIPEFEGDASQSQRSRTPSPTPRSDGGHVESEGGERGEGSEEEDEGEDSEYGNIHIVELHKGEEPLGIYLTHYTSPDGVDLGVFIGRMDENGFAFKSGKMQCNDRILACNGVDFTKEHTTQQVKDIFYQMAQEPLLRMAISRGVSLPEGDPDDGRDGEGHVTSEVGGAQDDMDARRESGIGVSMATSADTSVGGIDVVGGVKDGGRRGESAPEPPGSPRISNQATPITLANTRQIGVKRTIELTKGSGGLGIGLTSRDVLTDNKNHPIYIKSIRSGGAAFQDGRLKLGDRLLSVNGEDIQGMRRPEVVRLLREAQGRVTLVVSRQEAVEEQEQDTDHLFPQNSHPSHQPETISKTVLTLDISLYNSNAAWLGITVYGKSSTAKKAGDMGIYIKSITPGGAAAMDGRLQKNDQILYVNRQNLTGKSNQEALDILRKALSCATDNDSKIRLVVARTVNAGGRPPMAVLGERPEEEEKEGEWYIEATSQEVGIDVPNEAPLPTESTPPPQQQAPPRKTSTHSLHSQQSSPRTSTSILTSTTSLELEQPSRGSTRGRSVTMGTNSLPRGRSPGAKSDLHRSASPLISAMSLPRADNALGSGEFDRLEPLNKLAPPHSPSQSPRPRPQSLRQESPASFEALYDHAAASVSTYHTLPTRGSHYGGGYDYPPYDHMTDSGPGSGGDRENRYSSLPADINGHHPMTSKYRPPQMSREFSASPSRHRSPISPVGYGEYPSYASNHSSRENSLRRNREISPFNTYDRHAGSMYSPYSSDTGSTASGTAYTVGVSSSADGSQLVPTRGSNRRMDRDRERERNRPERGSGRSTHSRSSSAHFQSTTFSSDVIPDGSSTLPRAMSRSSDRRGSGAARSTTPTNPESTSLCSLDELRYEDSESNMAFRRDDAGRISITKKTKKNPRQDLAHLTLDNTEPLVEGEASLLVRTGSEGCLHQHNNSTDQDRFNGLEVGPQLGLFKSSSLESLHNVMQHTIKRDMVDDGYDFRNRSTRHSFKRAVDRTIDGQAAEAGEEGEQRGVDVDFDLEHTDTSPAVISYTKKPKKKGFSLKKVFKRKGSKKEKSPKSRGSKTQSMHVDLQSIQSSLTPAEQELLTRYQINVRQHPELHSQESVPVSLSTLSFQASASLDDIDSDQPILASDLQPQRHSVAVAAEEYDSPSSPDEVLLSTMAKV